MMVRSTVFDRKEKSVVKRMRDVEEQDLYTRSRQD
jgi:hypothetical protein